jgi:hypothetical protein
MKHLKTVMLFFALACLGSTFLPQAKAGEWHQKTIITFNQPVEVPGIVLPAGSYVFKLGGDMSDRDIVQVYNKDENHLYATILAIPDYRLKATDRTVVTFRKGPTGSPEELKSWFYPGDTYGREFVYPKSVSHETGKG